MSEGPKLYTNKPKKGKTQKQFFAVKKQSFILLFFFFFVFSILGFGVWLLIDCLCSFTLQTNSPTEKISRGTSESQGVLNTIIIIINNGNSVFFSSTTSATTTKRVICSPLQVRLAYAFGCQSCCWRFRSFSYSSILNPQCMCVCECEYLFVYKVIEFIKWCNGF